MRVYVNYNVLNKNGKDYLDYNKELQKIIDDLKIRSENIKSNWDSPNSVIYNNLMNNYIEDLQVDANKMERHANLLLGIEDNFKAKDLEYKKHVSTEELEVINGVNNYENE